MNRRTLAIVILIFGLIMLSIVGLVFISSQGNQAQPQPEAVPVTDAQGTPIPDGGGVGVAPPSIIDTGGIEGTSPPMVEVVVSLQTVPRGWQMTEAELTTDMRLASEVQANVITNIQDAINLYARNDIFQGETLTYDDLVTDITAARAEEFGPSSLIPPGFIAAAIPLNRLSSVAYAVDEGDYVDIMLTFFFYQIDEQFQTYLPNDAVLFLDEILAEAEELGAAPGLTILSPFGRFEALATGEWAHVYPSEPQRPIPISMVLQNARVIQVGKWEPPKDPQAPTPTPEPAEDGEPTPTPTPAPIPTSTPFPESVVVALSPQQQLFLKYAIESDALVTFGLRGVNDGQLYSVENLDLDFFLQRYNIEVPPNFDFSVDNIVITVTAEPVDGGGDGNDGGGSSDGSES